MIPAALNTTHTKRCPLGGFNGKDKCLHRANCCCRGGERIDRAYVWEKIYALRSEIRYWEGRLFPVFER